LGRVGRVEQTESYANFLRQLAEFKSIEHADLPRGLEKGISFYPYQQHGYNWLVFLRRFGLNGILADDMGLGKTLQALIIEESAKLEANWPVWDPVSQFVFRRLTAPADPADPPALFGAGNSFRPPGL
jgi:SNF2 family DNA or RNA helicase